MRRSETILFTRREGPGHANDTVDLALRAGLIRQFGSGLYGLTPTGHRVCSKVTALVEREMDAIGGQQVSLPALTGRELWERSGRWKRFEGEMLTLDNRDGQEFCLAPSHEEGMVRLVEGVVRSYEDLPLLLYQVGRKYRDDHARNGLLRMKEFRMKDAYSLHASRASLDEWYERVRTAYERIFDALDLEFVIAAADNSVMGGARSEEFIALAEQGTRSVRYCPAADCGVGVTDESPRAYRSAGDDCPACGDRLQRSEGIEIGHVFELGTRYAEPMELTVDTAAGGEQAVYMGSYGIGIDRLVHTLLEQHADEDGCRWSSDGSATVAPFDVAIVPLEYGGELRQVADELHELCGEDRSLLFDDPDQTIGERFAESDLLGIPWKVVLGNHYRDQGAVEIESRDGETRYVDTEEVPQIIDGGGLSCR